jgi:hypothetical protein
MPINAQTMAFPRGGWLLVLILPLLIGALVACGSHAPTGPKLHAENVWARPAKGMGEMSDASAGGETEMAHGQSTSAV